MEEDKKRLEVDIERLQILLAEAAPASFEAFRRNERRSSGGVSRDPRQRASRPAPSAGTSSRPVPAGAFLFGDGMSVGAYIGVIPVCSC